MELILDGKIILNKSILYKQLKMQINNEEFIGENLDALWDVLTMYNKITIIIKNDVLLKRNLNNYYDSLIILFEDLVKINENNKIIYER